MPTNADLQRLIDDLARRVGLVEDSVQHIEEQMKTDELKAIENNAILKRIEATVNGYETNIQNFIEFLKSLLKWGAGIAAIVIAGLIVAYVTTNFIR